MGNNAGKYFIDTNSNGTLLGNESVWPLPLSSLGGATPNEKSFHINHLKTVFRDLARPNKFKVKISPPKELGVWPTDIETLVKSASFPSVEIEDYQLERAGKTLHIPTNKVTYGDLSITFWNDVDFNFRSLFGRWQRLALFNWNKDIGSKPSLALSGFVSVIQYDSNSKPVYGVKVDNCWPKTIGEIALAHETVDTAEEFTVTFVFTSQEMYSAS